MKRHFISQNALAPLPRAETEGRVIMADFAVFHEKPDNRAHFIDTHDAGASGEDYLAGVEAGKAEAASVYESTIKVMENTLAQLKTSLETQVQEIEQSHARVVLQCLEAVLPALAQRSLLTEMQAVIRQTAAQETQGLLTARLHPDNAIVKSFLESHGANIQLIETEEMGETEVVFQWGVSRVEIDPLHNAETCLQLLSAAMPDTLWTSNSIADQGGIS